MSTKTWNNPNYDKVLHEDYTLVNAEIDNLKAENEQLHNKVSELTEQLDAVHVFCEGVKEIYIKDIEEAYDNMLHNGTILITKSQFIEYFKRYMKVD